jgi:hypothetical protein
VLLSASYRQRQKYFAEKATSGINNLIKEKGLTPTGYHPKII